ncbi:TetR family transcriptional regulator [Frankia sp. CNm7]|uniref:TetR family transcriptional regulator n=1 Tax=Frankia nepalensis TaxID=1836974 RepID=A0A937R5M9_9ACTN|nr:TetR/AcrR family transcriptional regulator [Frankia nepalensis]MBL7502353.1 TetR family transcriptional regulator [Frankia nepalensis]MBL7516194.1 TetR family transcriptional regulator [Frankia nepalensis]MBL7519864.1 TetR family transcriptional regulator [Frankia nepalensis]MBL7625686.1 TetR family transcriptional regulator [Frankia nepalensis]
MTEVIVRRSAKWELRRQAIIDTSARVFAQRGFHGTSTAELCEANQVGKGALYYYIGSKEQLLVAIHDRVMDEVMVGADRAASSGGTPPEQLAQLGAELLYVIHRYPDHVWVFLHEFPALTGENAETFRRRRRDYEIRVEEIFEAGQRSGHFRDIDPPMAAKAWLGMHNYTYLWLRPGGRVGVPDLAAQYADIFVRGISATPSTTTAATGVSPTDTVSVPPPAGPARTGPKKRRQGAA